MGSLSAETYPIRRFSGTVASKAKIRHCAGWLQSSVGMEGSGASEVVNFSSLRWANAVTRYAPLRDRLAGGVTFNFAYRSPTPENCSVSGGLTVQPCGAVTSDIHFRRLGGIRMHAQQNVERFFGLAPTIRWPDRVPRARVYAGTIRIAMRSMRVEVAAMWVTGWSAVKV